MMPNTEFTKSMISLTGSLAETTSVSIIISFLVNLFMSGPMDFLWGLVNTLQIVSHFPLIDVMMPANAYQLFIIIVKISDFSFIPVEETIFQIEQ